MRLRHRRNVVDLQLLPKQSYHVCRREEDAESILDTPLHLPLDEGSHLWGARRGVWPLGDGGIQFLVRPQGVVWAGMTFST